MRFLLIPTAAVVCCLSTGCSNDTSRARESARLFLSALSRGDANEAQKFTTMAARPYVAKITPESTTSKAGFTLGDTVVIKDNSAEVPAQFQGDDSKPYPGTVFLRKEENEWRVWALRIKLPSGYELMMDLEHPERMVGELLGAATGEFWKNSEKAGRQLGEALGGFMKGFSEGLEKTAPKAAPACGALSPPVIR
ncbi:hypothetical protein [Armatimonas sp.]|uniref:hypothetical protein n=1 Tax=Armatimonas sp. TaxID=1872638 RepID=UPI00286ACDBC|nr:hypothetical protein [Armatimonas sp.]